MFGSKGGHINHRFHYLRFSLSAGVGRSGTLVDKEAPTVHVLPQALEMLPSFAES